MITYVILASLSVPVTDLDPYEDLTLKKGVYSFSVICQNDNSWGPWQHSTNGEFTAKAGQWVRFLNNGFMGWHDTVLRVKDDGTLARTRHNDPSYRLDSPWWTGTEWRTGYVQVSEKAPIGTWHNEVWPKPALTLRTSNSEIYVNVRDAPSESLVLIGDNNKLHIYALAGEQSRLMQDRPTLLIKGNGNQVSGFVQSKMTGVNINGSRNKLVDLTVSIGPEAVGDDVGAVYFYGHGDFGNSATRTTVLNLGRAFPATHGHHAFYFDNWHDRGGLFESRAHGFMRGVFGHGATNTRVDQFSTTYCEKPWRFAPHTSTPEDLPVGNFVTRSK